MAVLSVLYVEDNDDLRATIGMLLEAADREIVTCPSAEEALRLDTQRRFDVIVTDVSLPGLSGTDLARRVLAADPQRWIVLCSGYEFGRDLSRLGPNVRALPKPFEVEQLETLMGEIAQRIHPG